MKISITYRRMAVEFGLGVGICGAAYYFGVLPLKAELALARESVARTMSVSPSGAASPTAVGKIDASKIEEVVAGALAAAAQVEKRSLPARNESAMFSILNVLAAAHGVQIDQLQAAKPTASADASAQPGAQAQRPAQPGEAAPSAGKLGPGHELPAVPGKSASSATTAPKDRRVYYTLNARASYADLTRFLAAVQFELGYTIINQLLLNNSSDVTSDMVSFQMTTEHVDFDATAVQLAAKSKPDAGPGLSAVPLTGDHALSRPRDQQAGVNP